MATDYIVVDLRNESGKKAGEDWWLSLTGAGGEGMVVKPMDFVVKKGKSILKPAVKCRGRDYLIMTIQSLDTISQFKNKSVKILLLWVSLAVLTAAFSVLYEMELEFAAPVFSRESGFYDDGFMLEIGSREGPWGALRSLISPESGASSWRSRRSDGDLGKMSIWIPEQSDTAIATYRR